MIKKGREKFMSMIPGKPSLQEVQKDVLTGIANVLRIVSA